MMKRVLVNKLTLLCILPFFGFIMSYYPKTSPNYVSMLSSDTDNDLDGIPDSIDVDDDNDGILDTDEGYCFYGDKFSFDEDNEGWFETTRSSGGDPEETGPVEHTTEDNSGDCISDADFPTPPSGTDFIYSDDHWSAGTWFESPSLEGTDVLASTAGNTDAYLSFFWFAGFKDIAPGDANLGTFIRVRLVGNGGQEITVLVDLAAFTNNTWQQLAIPLYPINWGVNITEDTGGNNVDWATNITDILSDLEQILMQVETLSGGTNGCSGTREYFGLHDVVLGCNEFWDTDGDGIFNHLDPDSDGDGCLDANEAGHDQIIQPDSTIQGPYGSNGLASSVETNDNQNAITNYTFLENGSGGLAVLDPTFDNCGVCPDALFHTIDTISICGEKTVELFTVTYDVSPDFSIDYIFEDASVDTLIEDTLLVENDMLIRMIAETIDTSLICIDTTLIVIDQNPYPSVDLSNDLILCNDNEVILTFFNGPLNGTVLFNDGLSNVSLTLDSSGEAQYTQTLVPGIPVTINLLEIDDGICIATHCP